MMSVLIFFNYYIFQTVVLDRSIPALGMSIVGGIDYCSKIFGCGQPGIYISKVHRPIQCIPGILPTLLY